MPWFKVDDGWHRSRKRIRAGLDLEGLAAQGLWAAAGSWASGELTDGWVPDDALTTLSPAISAKTREKLVDRLVRAGLWVREERDGENGSQFHDWKDRNPLKAQVLLEREAAAERQRRGRERARKEREAAQGVSRGVSRRDTHVTHNGSHVGVTEVVTGVVRTPRPDPTRPVLPTEVQNQEPLTVGGSLTKQDHPEDEKAAPTAAWQRVPKAWCTEHGSPDDKTCNGCRQDHGDRAFHAKARAAS